MTNPLVLGAAALVVLGLGELAAWLGVLFRHAIPKAPVVFHVLLTLTMPPAALCCFAAAVLVLSGRSEVFGLTILAVLVLFFALEAATFWALIAYAVYHHFRGRKCPV